MQGELRPSTPYRNIYSFTGECAKALLIPANFLSDRSKNSLEFALMQTGLYRRSYTSSNIIDSKLEIVNIPQKYHCRPPPPIIGYRIFCKAILPCSYYYKKYIYIFDYQNGDIDSVVISTVSKNFTMKRIQ